MFEDWRSSFGTDLNQGYNSADVYAGNGIGNDIGGTVMALADQDVGDQGLDLAGFFGGPLVGDIDINIGVNTANVVVGNGAFNDIGGDVIAAATQTVGDTEGLLGL
ncbi:hypothetical protein [Chthonobacter rhizosphaerae]|uniref:hypothetical protein n=1 Tax=Chthonobacter rhizosphaerae TaxID=2735553 RepID=UPI0015EF9DFD|nr:hypothetical protein [Chthonobacter rhizosphaerae]